MIREATLKDVEKIVKIINESNYQAFRKIIPKEFFKYPITDISMILKDMKEMKFYIYEVNSEVVGVAALKPDQEKKTGFIRWVYVAPKHQHKGIGTALIKHIEETAEKLNLKKLQLITPEKAIWAIKFYKKLGYKIVNYIQAKTWKDVIMEKDLK